MQNETSLSSPDCTSLKASTLSIVSGDIGLGMDVLVLVEGNAGNFFYPVLVVGHSHVDAG